MSYEKSAPSRMTTSRSPDSMGRMVFFIVQQAFRYIKKKTVQNADPENR